MLSDGVSTTVITAQPGGSEFLQEALITRGCEKLPSTVKLISDPDHALLVKDAGDIFLTEVQSNYMDQTYTMVQPALVVIDSETGKTLPELTWSWKTMELAPDQLVETHEILPGLELVAYRPVISDLRAAIKERRPVKLAPVAMSMDEIETQCKKYGDWVE